MTKLTRLAFTCVIGVCGTLLVVNSSFAFSKNEASELFPSKKTCVAYQTEKTFFFIRTVKVIGKNCELNAQVIPEPDDKFHIEINIPIANFESGEDERDRDVAKLLKSDISKELLFLSESIARDLWKEKIEAGDFELPGELRIGDKKYPLTIEASRAELESVFYGVAKTTFKSFEIDPPALLTGVGARVSEKLSLLFQLNTDDVLGAQTLLE